MGWIIGLGLIMYFLHLFVLHRIPKKWGFKYTMGAFYDDIEIDEGLPNYFKALKNSHCDEILKEHDEVREVFGFEIEDYNVIQKVAEAKAKNVYKNNRFIEGVPTYNMLRNPEYCALFSYYGSHIEDRHKFIVDADDDEENDFKHSLMVLVLLNLAYVPFEVAKKFQFKGDFISIFQKAWADYKIAFDERNEKNGAKWDYSSPELINDFLSEKHRIDK